MQNPMRQSLGLLVSLCSYNIGELDAHPTQDGLMPTIERDIDDEILVLE